MNHPYQDFLHLLEKPARYVGGEYQTISKPSASIRFALAFPDVYEIGMSHMGFKILYGILNKCADIAAERVFAPWTDLEAELRKRNLPLASLETGRALSEFDVIGFSLQYEMTYTNLLNMLDLCGIPLRSEHRDLSHPLIVAGGPCATSPEPMSPFIDLFVIGDGEEISVELCRAWKKWRDESLPRAEILKRFSTWQGLYVPSCYETEIDERTDLEVVAGPKFEGAKFPIARRVITDINKFPFPDDSPVAFTEVVFDRLSIELARGCTEGCRFCQAGMIYRPVRERDPKQVIDTILSGVKKGGYDEASLTALSTADYSCVSPLIKELMKELRKRDVSLGVSSLRAYGLGEEVLDDMADGGASGLTFAPEAGTQRMRDVIAKNISEEEMLITARRVFERAWRRVKLYFMIGLPTETEEDVIGIAETARRVSAVGREAAGRPVDVTVSVSSHVPKPHTPFQWAGMDSLEEIQRKQELLFRLSKKYRLNFRKHNPLVSRIEGIVSRGDRRVSNVIERAFKMGCRFDGWDEKLNFPAWIEAMKECGVDEHVYLRPLAVDGRLPWQHIDVGVTQKFLATEYRRAIQGRLSPPCGKPFGGKVHHSNLSDHEADQKKLVCYHCGIACDMSDMRTERATFLTELKAFDPPPPSLVKKVRTAKKGAIAADGPRFPVRLTYTKLPPASYVSHLDLIRMLSRQFRRAEIPIGQTGGFHPQPDMSFGPALSLGVPSLGELMDCRLMQPMDPEVLLDRLNSVSEAGVRYVKAEVLKDRAMPLSKSIVAADYVVSVPTVEDREVAISRLSSGESLTAIHERNGKVRQFEVNEELIGHGLLDPSSLPVELAEFGETLLRLRLRIRPEGSLRPHDLLVSLFGSDGSSWKVARLALLTEPEVAKPVDVVASMGLRTTETLAI